MKLQFEACIILQARNDVVYDNWSLAQQYKHVIGLSVTSHTCFICVIFKQHGIEALTTEQNKQLDQTASTGNQLN